MEQTELVLSVHRRVEVVKTFFGDTIVRVKQAD